MKYYNFFYKVKSLFGIIAIFKNWPIYLAFRFNLLDRNKERMYFLRNGLKIFAANTEPWGMKGVFVDKEYVRQSKISNNYTMIDIGANIGAFSIFAATAAKNVRVYSFEPVPETFSRLAKNIEINNLAAFIKSFELGIGGRNEKRKIFIDSDSSMANSLYQKNEAADKFIEIKVISLQDIFTENAIERCDFLKVDAEGAEQEIFFSTPPEYLHKIKNIVIEYDEKFEDLKNFLEKNGFFITIVPKNHSMGLLYAKLNEKMIPEKVVQQKQRIKRILAKVFSPYFRVVKLFNHKPKFTILMYH